MLGYGSLMTLTGF